LWIAVKSGGGEHLKGVFEGGAGHEASGGREVHRGSGSSKDRNFRVEI
jgi:hypothetical protein